MNWLGDYPEDFTAVSVYFTTHDSQGNPVAPLTAFEADDVKIYKDGDAAQKTTTNGLTMTSPFDSIVGLHRLLIDTSINTGDTSFWVGGHVYSVVLNPDTETVNSQTPLKVIGTFGLALAANGGAAPPTAASIAAAVWDLARSGHSTSGTFGEGVASVQGNVTGSVASVSGAVGSVGGNVVGSVGSVTARVTANTDQFAGQTITAGAGVTLPSTVASPTNITAGTITTATNVTTVNGLAAGVITATSITDGAITAAKIADAAIDAATFASGALDAVWSTATRLLSAGTNIVLAKGTGVTGFTDLDAAGVRTAVGLGLANLDTQLDALPTANENADALLDRSAGVETSRTPRQALRLMLAALAGKASGLATTTAVYRDTNDSKDRITATVDADGNRSAVTLDAS